MGERGEEGMCVSGSRRRAWANGNRFLLLLATVRAPQDSEQECNGEKRGEDSHSPRILGILASEITGPGTH